VECSAESGLKPDGGPKTLRLQKCLGSLGIQKDVFIDLIVTLKALSEKDNMKPTVRAKADGYADRGSAEIPNHPHCPGVFTHLPTNNSTFQVFAN